MYSNLLKGRLDRRSFFIASAVASVTALVVMMIVLVPIALIGIISPKVGDSFVLKGVTLFAGAAIAVPYLVMMASLIIRRAHDFGSRGSLWILGLSSLLIAERILDMSTLRLIVILGILILCVFPGNKVRNFYGGKPSKKFKADFARWYNYSG